MITGLDRFAMRACPEKVADFFDRGHAPTFLEERVPKKLQTFSIEDMLSLLWKSVSRKSCRLFRSGTWSHSLEEIDFLLFWWKHQSGKRLTAAGRPDGPVLKLSGIA
jgi:hypothetical protein